MNHKTAFTDEQLRYLRLLAKQYPTVQDASKEIIKLSAILNLPKGTEHFMSDIHGEYEAFFHIFNSCSGEVKSKVEELFSNTLPRRERNDLATLIYYPAAKLALAAQENEDLDDWYRIILHRLVQVCRYVSGKHTRDWVRGMMPEAYADVIDELLYTQTGDGAQRNFYEDIISTIVSIEQAVPVIEALCTTIKRLTVEHMHIVGDIFDRGPRADIVMDSLMASSSVDIQWGNHDILWMGAAAGSRAMVSIVLSNAIHYNNIDGIETGYGISLRPLSVLANEVYDTCDTHRFKVTINGPDADQYTEKDRLLSARMYKAITVILFKLEGQMILRRPEFGMDDRLLLDKIDYENQSITIGGVTYHLDDCDLPTVDPADPYRLTAEEESVIDQLAESFRHSEKLQRHIRFLYSKGSLYKIYNGNLLFHGAIPMTEDKQLMEFTIGGKVRKGKEFLDYADKSARQAYYAKRGTPEWQFGLDFLWWLWCGRNSPIFGRDRMTTFERRLIADESAWTEPKNPYYTHYNDVDVCDMILAEFGLRGPHCHIINGHVPVKTKKGESPLKAGGKLIVIDGGFCKAYQKTSGIAGYTLIYNSHNYRIVSHQPFDGKENAITLNHDIDSYSVVFETLEKQAKIGDTDRGRQHQAHVDDLKLLLEAYRAGVVTEDHK